MQLDVQDEVVVVEVMLEVLMVEEDVVAELDVVVDHVGGEEVVDD